MMAVSCLMSWRQHYPSVSLLWELKPKSIADSCSACGLPKGKSGNRTPDAIEASGHALIEQYSIKFKKKKRASKYYFLTLQLPVFLNQAVQKEKGRKEEGRKRVIPSQLNWGCGKIKYPRSENSNQNQHIQCSVVFAGGAGGAHGE